jgi:hypothetical protein
MNRRIDNYRLRWGSCRVRWGSCRLGTDSYRVRRDSCKIEIDKYIKKYRDVGKMDRVWWRGIKNVRLEKSNIRGRYRMRRGI